MIYKNCFGPDAHWQLTADGRKTLSAKRVNKNGILTRTNTHTEPPDREQVDLCKRFLKILGVKTATVTSRSPWSYDLKHVVEDLFNTYISNGAMIVAAIELDYLVQQDRHDSPNADIGMRSIRRADRLYI